jgi:peptidoglycan hydrolase-like protein with peptidoglycan-binding domain
MGAKTIAALKKFQADHGLPVAGALDRKNIGRFGRQVRWTGSFI